MKRLLALFFTMAVQYCLLVINYRAVAHGSYFGTGATDLVLAFFSFSLIKWVGESKSNWERVFYVAGGFTGSLIALWLSIHILKT